MGLEVRLPEQRAQAGGRTVLGPVTPQRSRHMGAMDGTVVQTQERHESLGAAREEERFTVPIQLERVEQSNTKLRMFARRICRHPPPFQAQHHATSTFEALALTLDGGLRAPPLFVTLGYRYRLSPKDAIHVRRGTPPVRRIRAGIVRFHPSDQGGRTR